MIKQTKFQKQILALAQAMEQGCKKTRPLRDAFLRGGTSKLFACALGAAFVNGYSVESSLRLSDELGSWKAASQRQPIINIYNGERCWSLGTEIIDRNDVKRHSRQRIISWLRRLAKLSIPPEKWSDVK